MVYETEDLGPSNDGNLYCLSQGGLIHQFTSTCVWTGTHEDRLPPASLASGMEIFFWRPEFTAGHSCGEVTTTIRKIEYIKNGDNELCQIHTHGGDIIQGNDRSYNIQVLRIPDAETGQLCKLPVKGVMRPVETYSLIPGMVDASPNGVAVPAADASKKLRCDLDDSSDFSLNGGSVDDPELVTDSQVSNCIVGGVIVLWVAKCLDDSFELELEVRTRPIA